MSEIDLHGETEQSLVTALRQGRQEMLGRLYDAYAPTLMGVISRIVQDPGLAEEALRETFLVIWTRIGNYDPSKERLLTWCLAIARGTALQAVKTDRSYPAPNTTERPPYPAAPPPVDRKEEYLCGLDQLERTVLETIYLKGRSCAEAAGELRISEGEVKAVLKRAIAQLKAGKAT